MTLWTNLKPRERLLARTAAGLILVSVIAGIFYQGYTRIQGLDRRIEGIELELVNLNEYRSQRDSVEAAFRKVVQEHSSELTREEIHDGLRREIYRLALKNPDLAHRPGKAKNSNNYMVQIPTLREGILKEEGDGYREYQVRFTVPACGLMDMLLLTQRLESSDMLLRIDSFELTRDPSGALLRLTYEVTRTVLDDPDLELGEDDAADLAPGRLTL